MINEALVNEFEKEFTAAGGIFVKVKERLKAVSYIQKVLKEKGSDTCVSWDEPPLNEILGGLKDVKIINAQASNSEWRSSAITSEIGVTSADFAISNTGTVVLKAGNGKGRLASLLPPVHICVVDSKRFVSDISEIFAQTKGMNVEAQREFLTTCLTFITGPSRTADIELTLTIGVHGPKEVHVVVI